MELVSQKSGEKYKFYFKDGLKGVSFSHLKNFFLSKTEDDLIFTWLESCDDPNVRFPLLDAERILNSELLNTLYKELEDLGLEPRQKHHCFLIATIPTENPTEFTVNVRAPIVLEVASAQGAQLVLSNTSFLWAEPGFEALKNIPHETILGS